MEGHQDQEAAEQYYHIHGVYPAWSLAVPAADVGKLVSFLPDRPYPVAATGMKENNGAVASASSRGSKKDKSHNKSRNDNIRLPRDVLPIRYDVRLFPVLEKGNFSILGHVSIDLQCQMETDRIVLHSADIAVDLKSVKSVMRLDALESSHPINVVVHHPDEVTEISSKVTYEKGATVIRMLAAFLGEKTFRQGLINYLKSRQYGNAVQDDLWDALTKQAKVDKVPLPTGVKQIMDTWTLKMGFPVVTVTREYENSSVSLSQAIKCLSNGNQERFLMQRSNASSQDKTVYLWWVPLTYTTDFQTVGSTWLADGQTGKKHELSIPVDKNQWVIFNVDQMGYYRINYDSKNWQMIGQQLMTNHSAISVINRAQIMDDSLNLAEAGLLDYETALNLTRYLEQETDYVPWDAALSSMGYISSMMSRTSGYGLLKKHFRTIITPLYNLVGFDQKVGEDLLTTMLRTNAVSWACSMGNKDCISRAVNSYAQWMADPENIDVISPDLKGTVTCIAIREGDEVEWEFALNRYMASNVASERDFLLSSMSCSEQPWILARMLEMSLDPNSGIRKQDAARVISQVASHSLGRYLSFNFIREKWTKLREMVPTKFFSAIIKAVSTSFNTELELKELIQFREEKSDVFSGAERATQQSIEQAKNNLNWMRQNYQKVVDWLQRVY
ncbi:hypothetical protein DAPPUDRAFT_115736 [Daphnia pulex]|uniref:Aminopeptidase n=1 Tax=Daphnia pulex TaxID=6669 RepID=E9HMC2_DAPPU|nr:hypothetical protein DAPPUDRAFT_115736 [Daphnia pulex]|eukprot:EFX67117.1 hypothetical protein DAPPUDRAFT_115736 [Daphnia pulex]